MTHKQINHKTQKLSKDMKKQGYTSSKKPNNSKLSSEDALAEKPKKGNYRKPTSKKMDGEKFLAKDQKLVHLKEFNFFLNEDINILDDNEKKWLDSVIEVEDPNDLKIKNSIFSKLGINNRDDNWEVGSGY